MDSKEKKVTKERLEIPEQMLVKQSIHIVITIVISKGTEGLPGEPGLNGTKVSLPQNHDINSILLFQGDRGDIGPPGMVGLPGINGTIGPPGIKGSKV